MFSSKKKADEENKKKTKKSGNSSLEYELLVSIKEANIEKVQQLLNQSKERGISIINCIHAFSDKEGSARDYTPLQLAAHGGHTKIMELLIKEGADIDAPHYQYKPVGLFNFSNIGKETALHLAAEEGHLETVKFLVKAGATIDSLDGEGQTPLYFAARRLAAIGSVGEKRHSAAPYDHNKWSALRLVIKFLLEKKASISPTSELPAPAQFECVHTILNELVFEEKITTLQKEMSKLQAENSQLKKLLQNQAQEKPSSLNTHFSEKQQITPNGATEFKDLPNNVQTHIASYLDMPSLCFFAMADKRSLRNVLPVLMKRQENLLHPLRIVANYETSICYTQNVLYVCGRNDHGQLGLGHHNKCNLFTPIKNLSGTIQQVAIGESHLLVLTDRELYACGANDSGQLGLGHNRACNTLTPIKNLPGEILEVIAGGHHTFIVTDQGLFACGNNGNGQLGLGHNHSCNTLTPVKNLPGKIRQVIGGRYHTFVLTEIGLFACGNNANGQLGLGHTNPCNTLTPISGTLNNIQRVATGWYHTFVLTDSSLYACGHNGSGQLGLGNYASFHTLTLINNPPNNIQQVIMGAEYTLVLSDQNLHTCGKNDHGQLGLGQDEHKSSNTLTLIKNLPGKVQQVTGGEHHILVLTDQDLYGCGNNANDQLGLGYINNCNTLIPIKNLPSEIKQLFSFYRHVEQLKLLDQKNSQRQVLQL